MMNKKVSVIIPSYNSQETIVDSIISVINQTYRNLELIIVDDGSTDDTVRKCEEFLLNKSIAFKIIKKSNGGPSSARNQGINHSTGDLIAFLDSDDLWYPEKISISLEVFDKYPKVGIIGNLCDEKNKRDMYEIIKFKRLIFNNLFVTSSVVVKKDIITKNNIMFDEKLKYSEDFDMWLQLLNICDGIIINQKLMIYGDGKRGFGVSGLSGNLRKMQEGELEVLRKNYNKKSMSKIFYLIAISYSYLKYIRRIIICKIA